MKKELFRIKNIPAVLWGEKSDRIFIAVHGKMSDKYEAQGFAEKVAGKGYQTISFDLPEHGDRKNEKYPCMVWNGVHDLDIIGEYVCKNWNTICLYGSSLGAYFSLLAYKDLTIKKCLFLSPVVDMENLIYNIMSKYNINEQMLKEKGEIPTPMGETLYWDYYCYVKKHQVNKWEIPTAILYPSKDNLTARKIIDIFSSRFNCDLTVMDGGEHWFHTDQQISFLDKWLDEHI